MPGAFLPLLVPGSGMGGGTTAVVTPDYWEVDYSDDWGVALDDDLALDDDWNIVDDLMAVTYYRRTASSTFASGVQVNYVLKSAVDRDELADLGQAAGATATFHLWKSKLSGVTPKVNDVIKDDDNIRWSVTRVRNCDRGTGGVQRYRCEATREQ